MRVGLVEVKGRRNWRVCTAAACLVRRTLPILYDVEETSAPLARIASATASSQSKSDWCDEHPRWVTAVSRQVRTRSTLLGMEMTPDEGTWVDADFHSPQTSETISARAVVLVEGISDKLAIEALAVRRGRSLDAERVAIVPMGGSKNIGSFLELFGPRGSDVRLAGLCDVGEEGDFQRGLERAGLGSNLTRTDMEAIGFYVCVADLEDELIRSLGAAAVEQVIEAQGELGSFRTFQKQPAWQGRTDEEQLRRFFGTHGGRKIRSAPLLVDALDLAQVPRPLERVLAHVLR